MGRFKLFLLITSITSVSLAKSLDQWKLVKNNDEIKVWTLKSHSEVTVAFQISSHKNAIDWDKVDQKNFAKKFGENKKKSLQVIGVKAWKITSEEWKKTEYGHELVMEGSYTGPTDQKVMFKETQIYQTYKTFQILNTWPDTFSVGQKVADEFIHGLRHENKEI